MKKLELTNKQIFSSIKCLLHFNILKPTKSTSFFRRYFSRDVRNLSKAQGPVSRYCPTHFRHWSSNGWGLLPPLFATVRKTLADSCAGVIWMYLLVWFRDFALLIYGENNRASNNLKKKFFKTFSHAGLILWPFTIVGIVSNCMKKCI